MKHWKIQLAALLLLFAGAARGDVMLLVHGYLSNVFVWQQSGVAPVLQQFGWRPAAVLLGAPQGLIPVPLQGAQADDKLVFLQLDTRAPLIAQSNVVIAALRWIQDRYPDEDIILVGHSLGGLVGRLALVRGGARQVKALITIASPHLGTGLAYEGLEATDDPWFLRMMKEFFIGKEYRVVRQSRWMLRDILPPLPGRLLYWLNTRRHPDIAYYSIVRTSVNGMLGDPIVPGFSQDMANVPAIGSRSKRVIEGFSHFLSLLDGYTLVNIVDELRRKERQNAEAKPRR